MNAITVRLKATYNLGLGNVAAVAIYRILLKFGLHPVQKIHSSFLVDGPFFSSNNLPQVKLAKMGGARSSFLPFGYGDSIERKLPPDWHANVLTGYSDGKTRHMPWWKLSDFDPAIGDVKTVWEASRLQWLFGFCAEASESPDAINTLNSWLRNWCSENPPYLGLNWKCAQEASLRTLHLAIAALLLDQAQKPSAAIDAFVRIHLKRIIPTLEYARAQNNNHGTSEAAALFVGASWLLQAGQDAYLEKVQKLGRRYLSERLKKLICEDGSFSQYSTNYHRLLLDTLSIVELWRRALKLEPFEEVFYDQARRATRWLAAFVDPGTGRVPNIGAADGARLIPVTASDFLDYRPSVALASALFLDEQCDFDDSDVLKIFGLTPSVRKKRGREAHLFPDGGYAILQTGDAAAVMRFPRYRFRPSQCDALHVDLTVGGQNLLRDAGSYSYAAPLEQQDAFSGVQGHNSVQFDGRDQMPRLSRFLYGKWLNTSLRTEISVSDGGQSFAAGYEDSEGARHVRKLVLTKGKLRVEDEVSGFNEKAVLRWRMMPAKWHQLKSGITAEGFSLIVDCKTEFSTELTEGKESLRYLDEHLIPVFEITVRRPSVIITEIVWPE